MLGSQIIDKRSKSVGALYGRENNVRGRATKLETECSVAENRWDHTLHMITHFIDLIMSGLGRFADKKSSLIQIDDALVGDQKNRPNPHNVGASKEDDSRKEPNEKGDHAPLAFPPEWKQEEKR